MHTDWSKLSVQLQCFTSYIMYAENSLRVHCAPYVYKKKKKNSSQKRKKKKKNTKKKKQLKTKRKKNMYDTIMYSHELQSSLLEENYRFFAMHRLLWFNSNVGILLFAHFSLLSVDWICRVKENDKLNEICVVWNQFNEIFSSICGPLLFYMAKSNELTMFSFELLAKRLFITVEKTNKAQFTRFMSVFQVFWTSNR